jgi:3'(2'), 5'-bisphosphate nucleotidase
VNIALIENENPVLGVLFAPALGSLYFGVAGGPVWMESQKSKTQFNTLPRSAGLRMATSRFHDHPDTKRFAQANRVEVTVPIGAALKYARLAIGEIDVYPRMVGTSEWDTAAGQAILQAAGGGFIDLETGKPLRYGKPNRRNGKFLAFRAPYKMKDFNLALAR